MQQVWRCSIRIRGHLGRPWHDWLGGLTIANLPDGEALVFGEIPDEAALYGLLHRLQSAGLPLVSLHCMACTKAEQRAQV